MSENALTTNGGSAAAIEGLAGVAAEHALTATGESTAEPAGLPGGVSECSADKQAFRVPWGKAMMWIFLLSDTFIFTCFLTSYMNVRISTTVPWPNPSKVFALDIGGHEIPLLLIAIMTMVLITSSVSIAAFEWPKLILHEGVRPWGNPMGAPQFGSAFFMITGFHGLHVSAGVVYLSVVARRVWTGFYDRKGTYETVEVTGLYWHFVDLVWVFIFAFFYLW